MADALVSLTSLVAVTALLIAPVAWERRTK